MNSIEPISSIKILETGFSRKGKSTLLNLIFAKLIARESYKWNNEYTIISRRNKDNNDEEEIVGGLKIMILEGFKEENDINRKIIKELINISIEKYEKSLDVIIYIFFFLTKYRIFRGTDDFLRFFK